MDPQNKPSVLEFTSPAWPARVGGVSIFICTVGVYFYFPNVPLFVLGITFMLMLLAIFFTADIQVIADSSLRTFTITRN